MHKEPECLGLLIALDLQIVRTDVHSRPTLQVLAQSLLVRQLMLPMFLHPFYLLEDLPTQVWLLCRTSIAARRQTAVGRSSPLSSPDFVSAGFHEGLFPGKPLSGVLLSTTPGLMKQYPFVNSSGPVYQAALRHVQDMPRPPAPAPPSYRKTEVERLDLKLESLSLNPQAKEFVPPGSSQGHEVLLLPD